MEDRRLKLRIRRTVAQGGVNKKENTHEMEEEREIYYINSGWVKLS